MTCSVFRPLAWIAAIVLSVSFVPSLFGQDTKDTRNSVSLVEDNTDERAFEVTARVAITGDFLTAAKDGAIKLKVQSNAAYDFHERRIAGTGQGAEAYRMVRDYSGAEANSVVDTRKTNTKLNGSLRRLVAQGQSSGIEFYSTTHHLSRQDIDLLSMPGDTVAVMGMLPPGSIEKGETWKPPLWVVQSMTGVEAMLKNDLECRMKSFTAAGATVTFQGSIEGAVHGATTEITVNGSFIFDRKQNIIARFEMSQQEKRSVGTVSPGMDIVAKVTWDRKPIARSRITDEYVKSIPLIPEPTSALLSYRTPWGVTFQHDRNWHLFHQTPELSILRLVESGGLVAQLNVSKVVDSAPGEFTPESQFQDDIREALGERLTKIESAELVKRKDALRIYRVIANGTVGKQEMKWFYYLATAPSGKQTAFVFSVGAAELEKLTNRDLGIASSISFRTSGQIASSPK
jgi:hypothetical protein